MEYLGDTVTIIRHFSKKGKIGVFARRILEGVKGGEHRLYVSTVSLVEILYLSERNRITVNLDSTMNKIVDSENYGIVDLTPSIVKIAEAMHFPEIFDRLIISTARYLNAPLINSDLGIQKSGLVETIWS